MIKLISLLVVAVFMTACSTLKVSTDYDPSVDIKTKSSFAIVHKSATDSLIIDRINAAIKKELTAKGYKQAAQSDADFDVIYEYGSKNKTDVESNFVPIGFFGGYTEVDDYNYVQGTFDIRMIDPSTKKDFWTAKAKNELDTKETPEERTKYVNELVSKILEKFPTK